MKRKIILFNLQKSSKGIIWGIFSIQIGERFSLGQNGPFLFSSAEGKCTLLNYVKCSSRQGLSISDIEEGTEANASWEVTKTIKMGGTLSVDCGGIIVDLQYNIPECLSLRRNWVPPPLSPLASVSPPMDPKGQIDTVHSCKMLKQFCILKISILLEKITLF